MDEKLKKHGAISWAELMTTDMAGAKAFYADLFGWEYEDMPMEGGMVYSCLNANGDPVGGIMDIPPDAPPMPSNWGLYVTVDDADTTAEQAVARGGQILVPPKDIPEVGRFCVIQDPQGACINIISYV